MNKNIIYTIVGILFVVGALLWYGRPEAPSGSDATNTVYGSDEPSALRSDAIAFDFGSISMQDGYVRHTFQVTNTLAQPMTVTKIYTSCMCTTAYIGKDGEGLGKLGPFGMPGHGLNPKVKYELQPGETTEVAVVFDPNAHGPSGIGHIERLVYLENSVSSPLQLRFSATVTP